ncbi:MAG: adenylate/guanylate cyclase domain-containing protein [Candidatus Nitrosothermus koennekii]|nr:MAG: adenylate/guanylate cyclase domain-containing protein [Candidatus Nitrosothermus koennekii]
MNDNKLEPDAHRKREEQQLEFLLEFLSYSKNYCVCIVDMVGSTKAVMKLDGNQVMMYYSIFLNMMANIARSFNAVVVKNIGDSLLFYFPKTEDGDADAFKEAFECCLTMLDKRGEVNTLMNKEGLPEVSYRISSEYGSVVVAKMSTSSVNDIFGSTVNICSKINPIAKPNSFIIGQELYNRTRSFKEYIFTEIKDARLMKDYHVYLITRR